MVDILTGEVEDRQPMPEERGVDPAASAMGKKGGTGKGSEHDAGATRGDCEESGGQALGKGLERDIIIDITPT
jgi:hypothetical protein